MIIITIHVRDGLEKQKIIYNSDDVFLMFSFVYTVESRYLELARENENLFDIAGLRDIWTRNYYTKPCRKTRGKGNLFEIASCSR